MCDVPLGLALDSIEFGTVVVNAEGIITFYSKSYERLLGVPRAQVLGRHVTEVVENTRVHLVARSGEPEIGWEQTPAGQTMVVQCIPIRDEAGQVIGALGQVMVRDLAEIASLARKLTLLESKVEFFERALERLRLLHHPAGDIPGKSDAIQVVKRPAATAADRAGDSQAYNPQQAILDEKRDAVLQALRMSKGDKAKAAQLLGMHRTGLYQTLAGLAL